MPSHSLLLPGQGNPLGSDRTDNLNIGQLTVTYRALSWLVLQPYFQYGVVMIHATSGVVDFKPDAEDPRDPTADDGVFHTVKLLDNVYNRFAGGLRLVAGSAMVGFEGSVAIGTNSIQSDKLAGGVAPGTQFTRQVTGSLRVGVGF